MQLPNLPNCGAHCGGDAVGINDAAQIVGTAYMESDPSDTCCNHAVLWDGSAISNTITRLDTVDDAASQALAININGQVVGEQDVE